MPVLWQPIAQTSLQLANTTVPSIYTLNVITTQHIDKGVLFRFQMWDGLTATYDSAVAADSIAEFDLVVQQDIPAGTVLVVKMAPDSTALFGFTGTATYASGGSGVPATFFKSGASLLAFAFAPTASGGWSPARGKPMFAIGFTVPDASQVPSSCVAAGYPAAGVSLTAPNFPDQWSASTVNWTFHYEVTYPYVASNNGMLGSAACVRVPGIRVSSLNTLYVKGSWHNLRDILAQPWTVLKDNYLSTSRWVMYVTTAAPGATFSMTPDVGPFVLAAVPGQLAPVYWRPRYKDIDADSAPVPTRGQSFTYRDSGSAELGLLVTEPLQANQTIYFTHETYNAGVGGFGARNVVSGAASFVVHTPSFQWTTGSEPIAAGTVVLFRGIGAAAPARITVHDAHDTGANVGVVSHVTINSGAGTPITSLIVVSEWVQQFVGSARPVAAGAFITAVLSDQYAGDFPPLSPGLTTPITRFSGAQIYGRGKIFDNNSLPGQVQCALINSATFTQVYNNEPMPAKDLPVFVNLCNSTA